MLITRTFPIMADAETIYLGMRVHQAMDEAQALALDARVLICDYRIRDQPCEMRERAIRALARSSFTAARRALDMLPAREYATQGEPRD